MWSILESPRWIAFYIAKRMQLIYLAGNSIRFRPVDSEGSIIHKRQVFTGASKNREDYDEKHQSF